RGNAALDAPASITRSSVGSLPGFGLAQCRTRSVLKDAPTPERGSDQPCPGPEAVTSARQAEVVPDRQARFGLVEGVEVQAGRAACQQLLAHLADHLFAEGLDAADVIPVGFQLLADPARDFRPAGV